MTTQVVAHRHTGACTTAAIGLSRRRYIADQEIYDFRVRDKVMQLAQTRARLNLTQAQAAALLATSQANVSAYERGRLQPGRLVSERIEAFTALQTDSVYAKYTASTMPNLAVQIRNDLAANRSETDMLRVVIQASDDFRMLASPTDRNFFLAEPSPTASRQWDALIAGLAVHLCREAKMDRAPMWTTNPTLTLDEIWWFGRSGEVVDLRARAMREAVPSMRSRGVFFGRRNLESV